MLCGVVVGWLRPRWVVALPPLRALQLVASAVLWSSVALAVCCVAQVPALPWCYPPGGHDAVWVVAVGEPCLYLWA